MSGSRLPSATRLNAALVAIVAASGWLIATWAGAPIVGRVVAALAALVLGVALVAYLSWIVPTADVSDRELRRR